MEAKNVYKLQCTRRVITPERSLGSPEHARLSGERLSRRPPSPTELNSPLAVARCRKPPPHPLNNVTALQLLAWICGAIGLQLASGIGVALLRRRSALQASLQAATDEGPQPVAAAWSGWRTFRVARREFEDAAHMQCSFYLEPTDAAALPAFRPGQYLTLALQVPDTRAHAPPATRTTPRTITRCYSLSDRPEPSRYRITVKRVPAPPDSAGWPPGLASNHLHDRVQVGDVLTVKAPAGQFCIDPDPSLPVVLIAGGIGITPMLSMLAWCVAEQPQRAVHLYYGLRNGQEHAFKSELQGLSQSRSAIQLTVAYSRPGPDDVLGQDFQHAGHVDLDLLRRTLPHTRHQFYVCGPPLMMATLVPALQQWGVAQSDIHYEAFGPASMRATQTESTATAPAGVAPLAVQFKRSGRTLLWDGRDHNLLDFAERGGVPVESGCRSGGCGSCQTRLLSGTVGYASQPDHALPAGYCLLCVGTPQSALTLDA